MQVQLITPEKILFEGDATYVQIPGVMGEFGVLPNHAPLISTMREGVVSVEIAGGEKREFPVTRGVADVQAGSVTILVE